MLARIDEYCDEFALVFSRAGLTKFLAQKQPRSAYKRVRTFQSFIGNYRHNRREAVRFLTRQERVVTWSISLEELFKTPFGQQLETILIGEINREHYVWTREHLHDYEARRGELFAQVWPYLEQYLSATTNLELTYNNSVNESSKETIEKIRQDVCAVAQQFSTSMQHIAFGHDRQVVFQADDHRSLASAHLRDYFGEVEVVDLPQITATPS